MFIENAITVGENFYTAGVGPGGGSGGTAITQIISPSSNTSGIIIKTLSLVPNIVSPATGDVAYIYADTSAPSAAWDTTKRLIFIARGGDPAGGTGTPTNSVANHLPYPLAIPSGFGLWVATANGSTPDNSAATIAMTWDTPGIS